MRTQLTESLLAANASTANLRSSMADWSQLPKDLLQLISEKLNSELYSTRFRSVCSSWRSSSIPSYHHDHLSLQLPQFSNDTNSNTNSSPRHLSKHNIFLIKPPQDQQTLHRRPWLIRVGPDSNGKIQLWHPFSLFPRIPLNFPHHVFDFNQIPVHDLGHVFFLTHKAFVATYQGNQPVVVVSFDSFGGMSVFRCGDENWTWIDGTTTSSYGDICLFKGRPCEAIYSGETQMIQQDLSIHLMAEHVDTENIRSKFLFESECELLLVDCYGGDDVWIDVFRLDEKEKKWVNLTNIGDRVLFLGNESSFSASASDLCVANGNCIIYTDDAFRDLNDTECGLSVFHLDQGRVSPLSDYPEYFNLLGPPPEWITELHS